MTLARLALWGGDLEQAEHFARASLGIRSALDDRLGIVCCLEVLGEVASGRAQHARAARLLGATAAERASINAPPPPLERERHERVLAALREHRDSGVGEVAGIEAVVAEELKATGHTSGLPGPDVENPGTGTRPKVSG